MKGQVDEGKLALSTSRYETARDARTSSSTASGHIT
jgi:hypothetical protein